MPLKLFCEGRSCGSLQSRRLATLFPSWTGRSRKQPRTTACSPMKLSLYTCKVRVFYSQPENIGVSLFPPGMYPKPKHYTPEGSQMSSMASFRYGGNSPFLVLPCCENLRAKPWHMPPSVQLCQVLLLPSATKGRFRYLRLSCCYGDPYGETVGIDSGGAVLRNATRHNAVDATV